jgi:hypothetical protein
MPGTDKEERYTAVMRPLIECAACKLCWLPCIARRSAGPLSQTVLSGNPRMHTRRSSIQTTRLSESNVSTSTTGHSLAQSSTIVLDPFAAWLRQRAPEVGYNAVILHRELREQGFPGSVSTAIENGVCANFDEGGVGR